MWTALLLLGAGLCQHTATGQRAPHAQNTPPIIVVDRTWKLHSDEKIGFLVARVKALDEDEDEIVYGIKPSRFYDGSDLFFINNATGVVYLAGNLTGLEDEQYYLQVTADDGEILASLDIWVEVLPARGNLSEFERLPPRRTRPKLPPNLRLDTAGVTPRPPRPVTNILPVLPDLTVLPDRPERPDPPRSTTNSQETTTQSAPSSPSSSTGAPLSETMGTSSAVDLTPIVVPLVLVVVLAPAVGCAVYLCRKRWSARKKSLKAENYAIEFQRRSGFGSDATDKMADEQSSTWRHFDSKGIDATKWNLGQTNLSFSGSMKKDGSGGVVKMAAADNKWEFPRHHLRILHQLGEGCFGQVWKVEALDIAGVEGVSTVAVKTLKEAAGDKEKKDMLSEMEVMKLLDPHPNVVTMLGSCTEKDPIFLIMEYVSRGKLQTYLRESRTPNDYNNLHGPSGLLTSRDLTTFAYQVARGMHYLTEKGIIHRDLAARNVLVSEERICKVADFGFARDIIVSHVYERKTEGRLPIRWMAPESLYDNLFTAKSDVWSFGILLWEIVTLGSTPYPGMSAQEVMKKVREGFRLEKPEHCRRELFNLMYYCWSAEASSRPGFSEIVETLEKLLLTEMDYIELDRFPEHSYYNLTGLSGEKV